MGKRSIVLLLVLVFSVFLVAASITINDKNINTVYTAGDFLQGSIKLKLDNENSTTKLTAKYSGNITSTTLLTFLKTLVFPRPLFVLAVCDSL